MQLSFLLGEVQFAVFFPYHDFRSFREVSFQKLEAERVQKIMLNGPFERTGSHTQDQNHDPPPEP